MAIKPMIKPHLYHEKVSNIEDTGIDIIYKQDTNTIKKFQTMCIELGLDIRVLERADKTENTLIISVPYLKEVVIYERRWKKNDGWNDLGGI